MSSPGCFWSQYLSTAIGSLTKKVAESDKFSKALFLLTKMPVMVKLALPKDLISLEFSHHFYLTQQVAMSS